MSSLLPAPATGLDPIMHAHHDGLFICMELNQHKLSNPKEPEDYKPSTVDERISDVSYKRFLESTLVFKNYFGDVSVYDKLPAV